LRKQLAELFGCSESDVDEVVKSDQAARRELTRRGFLGAALALAAAPAVPEVDWSQRITYSIPKGPEMMFFHGQPMILKDVWAGPTERFILKFYESLKLHGKLLEPWREVSL
jgi:hypothetical protein